MSVRLDDRRPADGETVSTTHAARLAGISYRRINLWVQYGLVEVIREGVDGSGGRHRVPCRQLPGIITAARVQEAFERHGTASNVLTRELLRQIIEHHADGRLDLGDGVTITWTPEGQ